MEYKDGVEYGFQFEANGVRVNVKATFYGLTDEVKNKFISGCVAAIEKEENNDE